MDTWTANYFTTHQRRGVEIWLRVTVSGRAERVFDPIEDLQLKHVFRVNPTAMSTKLMHVILEDFEIDVEKATQALWIEIGKEAHGR